MARVPVSAIITTFNERDYIEDCVRSVEWADEIYLIDSFSTDGTVELVRERFPRVRLEQREYLGAASQKNYAIDRERSTTGSSTSTPTSASHPSCATRFFERSSMT